MATVAQLRELKFRRNGCVEYRGVICGWTRADYAPSGWTFYHKFESIGVMPKCFNRDHIKGRTLRELKQKLAVIFEEWIDEGSPK